MTLKNVPAHLTAVVARIKVIAAAAVTWLVFAGLLLTQLAGELGDLGPVGADIARWSLRAVTWIGTAVLIIRRVTPVLDRAGRGILPTEPVEHVRKVRFTGDSAVLKSAAGDVRKIFENLVDDDPRRDSAGPP